MNALREEIKDTISATIKEKLCSDADSVTTVSQSIAALNANAQYWNDLSNKAGSHSCRALELQLKMAEENVTTLLYEEAPEEALLEAAQEVHNIHFQLDQNMCLCEASLMPEQQVRFSADTGRNINIPSRGYGVNPIHEVHIARPEADAPSQRQSMPALSMTAQLDGAVVNRTTEYGGIQQMVRQAVQNASHETESGKSFLAKDSVKMGNCPTYSSERNLEKFGNWVVSVLRFMSLYNLLRPRAGKVQLQFLDQCLTDEAQEWFYQWDLESVIMGLQKWFMPTLSMNKVAVNYDTIMQGYMTVQQLHQELFMSALKPDIRDQVLKKGFTPEFSSIDELIDEAVTLDNAKCYTSGYNSNHGSFYLHKATNAKNSHAQHATTQNKSSTNQNAGSSNQHKSGNKPVQSCQTTQLLSTGGGELPTQSNPIRNAVKANNTVDRRVAGARIEEVILEEDEGQIEEFDEGTPHPEEQQDWEDQPDENDQQYHFNDEEYETRSIDEEVVHVNAVIKASGYNDHRRLYGIRVREVETELRVSAAVQTGGKEQPVYDHQSRRKA
ncbi:hypothetical protein M422DRAFT_244323 [Sphaerobolus stellatus SS14]|nr:hypothetical protein M422DRAFT_244323 [Sphaerobolus stellatus SS14]